MLAGLPDASKCLQGSQKLQVGRAAQGQTFWETLVPVEVERNKVLLLPKQFGHQQTQIGIRPQTSL
eukprot:6036133-Amphidinium_carterae.1